MSHFTVLVITPDNNPGTLEAALQPFHEYECTGIEDQYVVDVDVTDEVEKAWDKAGPEDRAVGKEQFALDYGGYRLYGERFYRRTNPNKKWDWWAVGGRWQGLLIPKDRAGTKSGKPGLMGSTSGRGGVDSLRRDNLDLGAMKAAAVGERRERWASCFKEAELLGLPVDQLEAKRRAFGRESERVRAAWDALPDAPGKPQYWDYRTENFDKELAKYDHVFNDWGPRATLDDVDIAAWIAAAPALAPYAILRGAEWLAKGEMGWFGYSDDKVKQGDWEAFCGTVLETTQPDHWLTMVDCHI